MATSLTKNPYVVPIDSDIISHLSKIYVNIKFIEDYIK